MKTFLLIVCFLSTNILNAQYDSSPTKRDSLHFKNSFFRIYPVLMNNDQKLNKDEAQIHFSKNSEANHLFKKYKNKYKVGLYSFVGFIGGNILAALALDNGKRSVAGIGITMSAYSFFNSIVFLSLGEARLKKAINSYNCSVPR